MFRKLSCLFSLVILFSCFTLVFSDDTLEISSPGYFGEQTNEFSSIHYLDNEFLSFNFCSLDNVTDLNFSLVCPSSYFETLSFVKDFSYVGSGACYYSNFDLRNRPCDDFTLKIEYSANAIEKQFERTFEREKESKLLNYVLSKDYSSLSSLDASYYLIVLGDLEGVDSADSSRVYEKLKEDRNNNDKCWPSSSCSIHETSSILSNLDFAGYDLTTRLLDDGKTYVEKNIIDNENTELDFTIELDHDFDSDEEIECVLTIDDDAEDDYTFDEDSSVKVTDSAAKSVEFECNASIDSIDFKLENLEGNVQVEETYDDVSSFTYTLEEFACIGRGSTCDYDDTIQSMTIYSSALDDASLFDSYLTSMFDVDGEQIRVDAGDDIRDTGKYLYYKNDEDLANFLKFEQNNDGSWGSGTSTQRIEKTAWAILGLQEYSSSSEYVGDGKKWIYFNEPTGGWGSLKNNALAYLAIKEQIKPYLIIDTFMDVGSEREITLQNPTIHNLKKVQFEVSESVRPFVSYVQDLGDLDGESSVTMNLSVNDNVYGTVTGDLLVKGYDGKNQPLELLRMPFNIMGEAPFSFLTSVVKIIPEVPSVRLRTSSPLSSSAEISCSYVNPFTGAQEQVVLSGNESTVLLDNPQALGGSFNMSFVCEYNANRFTVDHSFEVISIPESFSVSGLEGGIYALSSWENFSLPVVSEAQEAQTLTFSIEGSMDGNIFPSEETKILAADDTRDVFFGVDGSPEFLLALGNETNVGYLVISSSTGYEKKIPVVLAFDSVPVAKSGLSFWVWFLIILFCAGLIALFVVRYIRLQKEQEANPQEEEGGIYFDEMDFENYGKK
ncbi:MAG: hypothetical protein H6500_00800 [Candidatus Woesearchaeota archaeon]|nr:hypothetical protein [Nanoarchaeota archaeon]USN44371.1 MAG: hypothetical protein H6500_00800 [Candidatus Woesearchaeota archaeon]